MQVYSFSVIETSDQNPKGAFTQNSMDSNAVDLSTQFVLFHVHILKTSVQVVASYLLAVGVQREVLAHVRTSIYLLLVSVLVWTFFSWIFVMLIKLVIAQEESNLHTIFIINKKC